MSNMIDILIGAIGTIFTVGVIYLFAYIRGYSRGLDDAWSDAEKILDEFFKD